MRIKLLTGLTDGVTPFKPRSVVEWDDAESRVLIAAGMAVAADGPETATAPPDAELVSLPEKKAKPKKGK